MRYFFAIIFLSFLFVSCFAGIDKQGSVTGYSHGVVKTKGGAFRVGELPSAWKKQPIKFRAILFENQNDQATITLDSWCQRAVDDRSLEVLTQQLLKGITNIKIIKQETVDMDGRAALQTDASGTMDGQDIFISLYVLKMNYCVFDFFFVSKPNQLETLPDFKALVEGFDWLAGPKML